MWLENDLSKKGRLLANWWPWPIVVFFPIVGLMLLFQVSPVASLIGGVVGALIAAVVGLSGEGTVAARIAVTDSDLRWADRRGRNHSISLSRIGNIEKLPKQSESIIWYFDSSGKRRGFGVGPQVAHAISEALDRYLRP